MKILLLGSTGFIGSHMKPALIEAGYQVMDPRIEIRDITQIRQTVEAENPDIIFNATGITGKPNVDWCEDHPGETFSVNVGGSLNLATVAAEESLYMVQLGSGCIYDGEKEYTEEDQPNFTGSTYSRSRLISEQILKEFSNILQLRIRMPIIGKAHPKNFITKLTKYPKLINRRNACTVIEDFIPATLQLIADKQKGVFNMTNPGPMTHEEIMTLYKEIVDPSFEFNLMEASEQSKLCMRRSNCFLSSDKREKAGAHMPPLKESLTEILQNYA